MKNQFPPMIPQQQAVQSIALMPKLSADAALAAVSAKINRARAELEEAVAMLCQTAQTAQRSVESLSKINLIGSGIDRDAYVDQETAAGMAKTIEALCDQLNFFEALQGVSLISGAGQRCAPPPITVDQA